MWRNNLFINQLSEVQWLSINIRIYIQYKLPQLLTLSENSVVLSVLLWLPTCTFFTISGFFTPVSAIYYCLSAYLYPTSSMHPPPPLSLTVPTPPSFFLDFILSFQLQGCSPLATCSCQGLETVYLWLCYHVAFSMQLSFIQARMIPVSYCPLKFNETGV